MPFQSTQEDKLAPSTQTDLPTDFGVHLNIMRAPEDKHPLQETVMMKNTTALQDRQINLKSNSPSKWNVYLEDVDFDIVHDKFVSMFDVFKKQKNTKGETRTVKTKVWDALDPFLENPCYENALAFIEKTNGKCCMNIFKFSKR